MRNLDNFRQAVESPNSWNWMVYFCPKKYILSAKTLHRICLTLLSTTCVKIHQILYVIFKTISHFYDTTPRYFFWFKHYRLSTKVAHQSTNFFPLLALKFSKFLTPFFKQKLSFSSKFGSLFSVMRDNSPVLFIAETLYAIDKKRPWKCKYSDIRLLAWKLTKFLVSFFKPPVSFSLNNASPFNGMTHNSL